MKPILMQIHTQHRLIWSTRLYGQFFQQKKEILQMLERLWWVLCFKKTHHKRQENLWFVAYFISHHRWFSLLLLYFMVRTKKNLLKVDGEEIEGFWRPPLFLLWIEIIWKIFFSPFSFVTVLDWMNSRIFSNKID